MTIKWIGAHPNNFQVGRGGRRIDLLVLHWAVARMPAVDATFNDGNRIASATYMVDEDQVHQYVNEADTSFANSNYEYNQRSVTIEHAGGYLVNNQRVKPSPTTHETSALLVSQIAGRYGIPLDRAHVLGHQQVPGASTACPGTLDIDWIVNRAKQLQGGGDDVNIYEIYQKYFEVVYPGKSIEQRDAWAKEKAASQIDPKVIFQEVREGDRGDFHLGFYGQPAPTTYMKDKSGINAVQWGKETRGSVNTNADRRLEEVKALLAKPL
jgi:hypothetical protein